MVRPFRRGVDNNRVSQKSLVFLGKRKKQTNGKAFGERQKVKGSAVFDDVWAKNKHTGLFFLFRSHPISGAKLCAPNMVCFLFAIF